MTRTSQEDKPQNHDCDNCGEHRASMWWIGDGGTLAITRFYMQAAWCKCCALRAQIGHAEERTAELEKMRRKLVRTKCKLAKKETNDSPKATSG